MKGVRVRYKKGKEKKKELQLTKLVPLETSHLLRSELNDVASANIPLYNTLTLNYNKKNYHF